MVSLGSTVGLVVFYRRVCAHRQIRCKRSGCLKVPIYKTSCWIFRAYTNSIYKNGFDLLVQ